MNLIVNLKNVSIFCQKLNDRSNESGWGTTGGDAINILDSNGIERNLFTKYSILILENIRDYDIQNMNTNSGWAQNNVQMHVSLSKSLTDEGHIKIIEEFDKYRIDGVAAGTLLFILLMAKAAVDARAIESYLRENLTTLDTRMASASLNVELFNLGAKENRQELNARGKRTDDLTINLFKDYSAALDKEFAPQINKKTDKYDEGSDIVEN